ncbi:hypothetical protein [Herbaspirillum sp.]|uniref:hypothetical protein n=1 Tax=Herbaspirillum sp. TaxID=1890675 RepID=UPI0031D72CEE
MEYCQAMRMARQGEESGPGAGKACLALALYLSLAGVARRLGCVQLQQLLSAIPDSNDDFAGF